MSESMEAAKLQTYHNLTFARLLDDGYEQERNNYYASVKERVGIEVEGVDGRVIEHAMHHANYDLLQQHAPRALQNELAAIEAINEEEAMSQSDFAEYGPDIAKIDFYNSIRHEAVENSYQKALSLTGQITAPEVAEPEDLQLADDSFASDLALDLDDDNSEFDLDFDLDDEDMSIDPDEPILDSDFEGPSEEQIEQMFKEQKERMDAQYHQLAFARIMEDEYEQERGAYFNAVRQRLGIEELDDDSYNTIVEQAYLPENYDLMERFAPNAVAAEKLEVSEVTVETAIEVQSRLAGRDVTDGMSDLEGYNQESFKLIARHTNSLDYIQSKFSNSLEGFKDVEIVDVMDKEQVASTASINVEIPDLDAIAAKEGADPLESAYGEYKDLREVIENEGIRDENIDSLQLFTNKAMLHSLTLKRLMEDGNELEREHYFSAVRQRAGIDDLDDEESQRKFLKATMNPENYDQLEQTAEEALAAEKLAASQYDIDADLAAAGYDLTQLDDGFRRNSQLAGYYASQLGSSDEFRSVLADTRDMVLKGLGDKRVSLAISGAMLGVTALGGGGGLVLGIAALRFGSKLMDTKLGNQFTSAINNRIRSFIEKMGGNPETYDKLIAKPRKVREAMMNTIGGNIALSAVSITAAIAMGDGSDIGKAWENIKGGAEAVADWWEGDVPSADADSAPKMVDGVVVPESFAETVATVPPEGDVQEMIREQFIRANGHEPTQAQIHSIVGYMEHIDKTLANAYLLGEGETFTMPSSDFFQEIGQGSGMSSLYYDEVRPNIYSPVVGNIDATQLAIALNDNGIRLTDPRIATYLAENGGMASLGTTEGLERALDAISEEFGVNIREEIATRISEPFNEVLFEGNGATIEGFGDYITQEVEALHGVNLEYSPSKLAEIMEKVAEFNGYTSPQEMLDAGSPVKMPNDYLNSEPVTKLSMSGEERPQFGREAGVSGPTATAPEASAGEATGVKPFTTDITVEKDDTLWKLTSDQYEAYHGEKPSNQQIMAMVQEVAKTNGLANPDLIYPDQKLVLSSPEFLDGIEAYPPTISAASPDVANTNHEGKPYVQRDAPASTATSPEVADTAEQPRHHQPREALMIDRTIDDVIQAEFLIHGIENPTAEQINTIKSAIAEANGMASVEDLNNVEGMMLEIPDMDKELNAMKQWPSSVTMGTNSSLDDLVERQLMERGGIQNPTELQTRLYTEQLAELNGVSVKKLAKMAAIAGKEIAVPDSAVPALDIADINKSYVTVGVGEKLDDVVISQLMEKGGIQNPTELQKDIFKKEMANLNDVSMKKLAKMATAGADLRIPDVPDLAQGLSDIDKTYRVGPNNSVAGLAKHVLNEAYSGTAVSYGQQDISRLAESIADYNGISSKDIYKNGITDKLHIPKIAQEALASAAETQEVLLSEARQGGAGKWIHETVVNGLNSYNGLPPANFGPDAINVSEVFDQSLKDLEAKQLAYKVEVTESVPSYTAEPKVSVEAEHVDMSESTPAQDEGAKAPQPEKEATQPQQVTEKPSEELVRKLHNGEIPAKDAEAIVNNYTMGYNGTEQITAEAYNKAIDFAFEQAGGLKAKFDAAVAGIAESEKGQMLAKELSDYRDWSNTQIDAVDKFMLDENFIKEREIATAVASSTADALLTHHENKEQAKAEKALELKDLWVGNINKHLDESPEIKERLGEVRRELSAKEMIEENTKIIMESAGGGGLKIDESIADIDKKVVLAAQRMAASEVAMGYAKDAFENARREVEKHLGGLIYEQSLSDTAEVAKEVGAAKVVADKKLDAQLTNDVKDISKEIQNNQKAPEKTEIEKEAVLKEQLNKYQAKQSYVMDVEKAQMGMADFSDKVSREFESERQKIQRDMEENRQQLKESIDNLKKNSKLEQEKLNREAQGLIQAQERRVKEKIKTVEKEHANDPEKIRNVSHAVRESSRKYADNVRKAVATQSQGIKGRLANGINSANDKHNNRALGLELKLANAKHEATSKIQNESLKVSTRLLNQHGPTGKYSYMQQHNMTGYNAKQEQEKQEQMERQNKDMEKELRREQETQAKTTETKGIDREAEKKEEQRKEEEKQVVQQQSNQRSRRPSGPSVRM